MNPIKAQIIAEKGPIVIGNDNLIEEGVIIKNSNEETLYVGNENIFEVQSQFEGDYQGWSMGHRLWAEKTLSL